MEISDKKVLDELQYELFIRFNNSAERRERHIDTYFLDNPELDQEGIERLKQRNIELLKKDTLKQIVDHPEVLNLTKEELKQRVDYIYNEIMELGKSVDELTDEEIENLIYEKFLRLECSEC